MADWLSLGATLAGGLLGAASGGDQQQTQTATKDPWAPAQPYMLQNLQNEAALQTNLQQNPFNQQQITGYSNLFGDIGNYRDNVMPGLMDFANRGMTSSYQRQTGGAPGSGGGYGGAVRPGGLMSSGQTGPFSVNRGAQGQNTMLDLNGAQNPYVNGSVKAPTPQTSVAAPTGNTGGLLGNQGGSGGGYGGSAGPASGGIGIGSYTDAINDKAMGIAQKYGMASPFVGVLAGLISQGMSESQALSAVNAMTDPIAGLNALQGWTGVDQSYDLYGFGGGNGYGLNDSTFGGYGSGGYGGNSGDGDGPGNGNGGGSNDRGTGSERD